MAKDNDLSEKPSLGVENPAWSTPEGDTIKGIGKEKLDALKTSISEIKVLIDERQKLSLQVLAEGDQEKRDIDNFLLDVGAKMEAGDIEGEKERIALRQKRVDVSELQLREKISAWQDIARLKQELREQERELSEKESRIGMLGKILE